MKDVLVDACEWGAPVGRQGTLSSRLLAANRNWSEEDRGLINYFRPQLDDLKTVEDVNHFYACTKFGKSLRGFLLEYIMFGPKKFTFCCGTRDGITGHDYYYKCLDDACLVFGTPMKPLETPWEEFWHYEFIIQAPRKRFGMIDNCCTDPVAICNGIHNLKVSYDKKESKAKQPPLMQHNDALEATLIDVVTNGKQVIPTKYQRR